MYYLKNVLQTCLELIFVSKRSVSRLLHSNCCSPKLVSFIFTQNIMIKAITTDNKYDY